ncbi:apolipoprotein N-acyltransferase [candidate division TA06 bacterium]|uniref:Apolipoprotein N-acyltransferase n=1 Tax=candidate division TA06 bacterium TaxID=2250710 RepID=A0A933MJV9_UNCT6|nr:apolipoprotein N-acyltransferase [candidate division TA06 bacterium]
MNGKRPISLFLTGLTSLLLFSAFPLFSLWPLAFVCLIPLMAAAKDLSVKKTFMLSWLSGTAFYIGLLHWIVFNPAVEGWVRPLLYLGVALIGFYLSLYFAASFALAKWLAGRSKIPFWAWLALCLPALDFIRSQGLLGFPWGSLGYALAPWTSSIQMASLTGVYGLTCWAVLVNGLLFALGSSLWKERTRLAEVFRRPKTVAQIIVLALLLLLPPWLGHLAVRSVEKISMESPQMKTALIQGNIQQGLRWDKEFQRFNFNAYKRLTGEASAQKAGLVIWPETAMPFYLRYQAQYFKELCQLSEVTGSMILTGAPDLAIGESQKELYFNAAFLFTPGQGLVGSYAKSQLVPFGERFPLKNNIPFLKNVSFGEGEWTSGQDTVVFKTPDLILSCLICFESIFPAIARHQVNRGSKILVNITNDGWFGRSGAALQHAQMSVLRAVENRRAVARCANSGISMFILPSGRVAQPTPLYQQTVTVESLPLLSFRTFYSRFGDVFIYILILLIAAAALITLVKRRT